MTKKSWIAFVRQWKTSFLRAVFHFLRSCINIFSESYKRFLRPETEKMDHKRRRRHRRRRKNEKLKGESYENGSKELAVPSEHKISVSNRNGTGEDAVGRFQDLTISSAPHVSVKNSTTADSSPAEEFLPPSDTLPAEGNLPLPYIKKYTGKERKIGSPCSQILIETSVPKVPVKHSASADVPPAEEDIGTMESNRTERKRIDLSSFNAQNSSNTKEATANLKMKAPAKIVSRAETVHHNNRRNHKQIRNMKKINSAKVVKQWGRNKPCNHPGDPESNAPFDFKTWPQLPNVNNNTEEEKKIGAVALFGMKATAIIASRGKVSDKPSNVTGWHPEMDGIHPSAEELEAGITFERLYDILCHHEHNPPPSPHARLPVFENICRELQPVPSQESTKLYLLNRSKEEYVRDFPLLSRKMTNTTKRTGQRSV